MIIIIFMMHDAWRMIYNLFACLVQTYLTWVYSYRPWLMRFSPDAPSCVQNSVHFFLLVVYTNIEMNLDDYCMQGYTYAKKKSINLKLIINQDHLQHASNLRFSKLANNQFKGVSGDCHRRFVNLCFRQLADPLGSPSFFIEAVHNQGMGQFLQALRPELWPIPIEL